MAKREVIIVRKTQGGLSPVSPYEAELLDQYPLGADLEIMVKQRRSLPQHRTYFAMLAYVNKATEAYPNVEKLNEALKMHLGYVTTLQRFNGEEVIVADSIAFAAMDQAAFKVFFEQAVAALSEKFGFDPLGFMDRERKAA